MIKIDIFLRSCKIAYFLTALAQENAATHIIVFAVQIAITFLILGFIWHWFYRRRIKALENRARKRVREELKAFEERAVRYREEWAEYEKKFNDVMAKHQVFMQLVPAVKNMMEKTETAAAQMRTALEQKIAEIKSPSEPPRPNPEQQGMPEKK